MSRLLLVWSSALATTSFPTATQRSEPRDQGVSAPIQTVVVRQRYPHDRRAFTQGLEYLDGFLYESTGLLGESTLRKVELETGRVRQSVALDPEHFGEGLTLWKSQVIQLTWRNRIALVFDRASLRRVSTVSYAGEGWGLTHNGTHLFASDGTSSIRILSPSTLQEIGRFTVTDAGKPVTGLNELEYIDGQIYANMWPTHFAVRIDPKSGRVLARIDLSGVLTEVGALGNVDVLNGIAYDDTNRRLFITGKRWPFVFHVSLVSDRDRPRTKP